MGVILDTCSPQEFFFCVGDTCAAIKTSLCKGVETQTCDVGERKVESRSNTSGEVGSRFPCTIFSSVRGESKYSLVVGGQRGNRIELANTSAGYSVLEETSTSHAP